MSNPFHGRAIVSLTFDDNDKCQITTTDPILRDHGVRGTFYNLVSRVDQDGYLSLEDVRALVRNGHRAGSHAIDHKRLTEMTWQEVERQVVSSKDWWAERRIATSSWLIILFHQIREAAPSRFDYRIVDFEEVLRYITSRELPGPTIEEVVEGGD